MSNWGSEGGLKEPRLPLTSVESPSFTLEELRDYTEKERSESKKIQNRYIITSWVWSLNNRSMNDKMIINKDWRCEDQLEREDKWEKNVLEKAMISRSWKKT